MSTAPNDRSQRQSKIAAAAPKERSVKPLLITLVSALAIVAIVAAIWFGSRGDDSGASNVASNGRTYPAGATGDSGGIVVNAGKAKAGAPTLDIYEDFQCPICKQAEDMLGPTIQKMADAGEVKVVYNMKSFLEKNPNIQNDSSTRPAIAAACAADAGVFEKYHDTVFANQPAREGAGYTDDQLMTFAQQSGITGTKLETFKKCYADKQYATYVKTMEDTTARAGVVATPTFRVNGKDVDMNKVTSAESFRQQVLAAGGANASASK